MTNDPTYTAFIGTSRLFTGSLPALLEATKAHLDGSATKAHDLLIFEDTSGRTLDFDFRDTLDEVLARALPAAKPSGPGRPKLGVVSREVSLLPRHWDWLEGQRGGASAALRRLIDDARKANPQAERQRQATEAAGRFMTVMAGDLPGYEEASRALYAGDPARLQALTEGWPAAVQTHLQYLLDPPFWGPI